MSIPELSEIPGAQELGHIDGLDAYFRERGADYIADKTNFPITAEEVEATTARGREALMREQPVDRKAALLVQRAYDVLGQRQYATTETLLAHTALTDVLADEYNVDVARHMGGEIERLYLNIGIARSTAGKMVYINYGIGTGEPHGLFWQLNIDKEYGFANMHCVGPLGNAMLRGSANVIGIDGVAEALESDITLLESPQDS